MNTLGHLFRVTSFGESHGPAVGCVLDGCPAGLVLDLDLIQRKVDLRRTGQQAFSSARREEDQVHLLSGIVEGKTLGSPIALLIQNQDARSNDYDDLKEVFRPGHADFTYAIKYGLRDHRGGGRSSIRITAPLVAAGEIARQFLVSRCPELLIQSYVCRIGSVSMAEVYSAEPEAANEDPHRCPDKACSELMAAEIASAIATGDTLGGEIACLVSGIPVGWGEPVFGKVQAQLAHAMMSINTVKGFEYGEGFAAAQQRGSAHNDAFEQIKGRIRPAGNKHGGLLGGITTAEPIRFRVALKPISSIRQEQQTVTNSGESLNLSIGGRHDVCAVPRAVSIVEAYTALVLADLMIQSSKQSNA